jgi:hypothetical protein
MATETKLTRILNIGGLNLYTNPLLKKDGDLIRAVNVDSDPYGAKSKRGGVTTFLGTAEGSAVRDLYAWKKDDNSTTFWYRVSGTQVYYSAQGTSAWTACTNGVVNGTSRVSFAVIDNTLVMGDGLGSTRHTTNGTAFTDTSGAPVAKDFEEYQGRLYAMGTGNNIFYSNAIAGTETYAGTTAWLTSPTTLYDSSSIKIPDAGGLSSIFKVADKLIINKTSRKMFKWDGFSLIDTASEMGPSSPYSVGNAEGYNFWLNDVGIVGYGGDRPQLLSNAIQPQIYNNMGSGVAGTAFDKAPGAVHRYDYFLAAGTITDDFTNETVNDCVFKYNFQKNEFLNYKFAQFPTCFFSHRDSDGNKQMVYGAANGQCYKLSGTAVTDNGSPIESYMMMIVDLSEPEFDKEWYKWVGFFNPGCQAKVAVACADTYVKESLNWKELGDASSGVIEERFPAGSRSKFLYIRIYDSSTTKGYTYYGSSVRARVIRD